jgi:predicted enzyme related to lactoylglutathione lyase
MNTTSPAIMKLSIEVITLPVSDIERALRFYVDQLGFTLDVDYSPNDAFRVVQLTPPGSSCSIQIGRRLSDASVGSPRSIYLVVTDLETTRSRLLERGIKSTLGQQDRGTSEAERQSQTSHDIPIPRAITFFASAPARQTEAHDDQSGDDIV